MKVHYQIIPDLSKINLFVENILQTTNENMSLCFTKLSITLQKDVWPSFDPVIDLIIGTQSAERKKGRERERERERVRGEEGEIEREGESEGGEGERGGGEGESCVPSEQFIFLYKIRLEQNIHLWFCIMGHCKSLNNWSSSFNLFGTSIY